MLTTRRTRGYVKTLCGRRRYLPKITAGANPHARAAAERQAINTAVQGSAADLVKAAMNTIERRVAEVFPQCRSPLRPSCRRPEESRQGWKHCGANSTGFFMLSFGACTVHGLSGHHRGYVIGFMGGGRGTRS